MLCYSMDIQWSADDNAYLAAFHDLPECATGDTYEEAARNGREALEAFIEAAKECGEELPEPTELKSMREGIQTNSKRKWISSKKTLFRLLTASFVLCTKDLHT